MRRAAPIAFLGIVLALACTRGTLDLTQGSASPSPTGSIPPTPIPTPCTMSGQICTVTSPGVGDGGPALQARFLTPQGWAMAPDGAILIADSEDARIRRIGVDGVVTTLAGNGFAGASTPTGTVATAGSLVYPGSIAAAPNGWIYFADYVENVVYGIDPATQVISVIAGGGTMGTTDDVLATEAAFDFGFQAQISLGLTGTTLFIPDTNRHLVRVVNLGTTGATVASRPIASGHIVTIAGTGTAGFSGNGSFAIVAALNKPSCAVETSAGINVCDTANGRLRLVDAAGIISAITDGGSGVDGNTPVPLATAKLDQPGSLAVAPNGLIMVQAFDNTVRAVNLGMSSLNWGGIAIPGGTVTRVGGDGSRGWFRNEGAAALTQGLATGYSGPLFDAAGDMLLLDNDNSVVRKVSSVDDSMRIMSGLAGASSSAFLLTETADIAVEGSSGNAIVSANGTAHLLRVNIDGTRTNFAGNGSPDFSGDGGQAINAGFFAQGIARAPDGTIFVADDRNHRVRMISPSGVITTVAGSGVYARHMTGDGVPALLAKFTGPGSVALDGAGNLYILDDYCVHVVNLGVADLNIGNVTISSGDMDRIGGICDQPGLGGDSVDARSTKYNFRDPSSKSGIAVGSTFIFLADTNNNRIRRINIATGQSSTFLGGATSGSTGDGGPASAARAGHPLRLNLANGYLYWSEQFSARIRRADVAGTLVEPVAGSGRQGSSGDDGPAGSADLKPNGVSTAPDGTVWIATENRVRRVLP